jgi:hypothetical protein
MKSDLKNLANQQELVYFGQQLHLLGRRKRMTLDLEPPARVSVEP